MKNCFILFLLLTSATGMYAQQAKPTGALQAHNNVINGLLKLNHPAATAMKTTAGTLTQRVIAQSTRDNSMATLADSVRTKYSGMHRSTYDYNTMIYPYNYTYGTTPMFGFSGIFTTPQVEYDTYVHWTLNPFTMPAFALYEGNFATYDTNNNQVTFKKLFADSVVNDNVSYVNTFSAANNIDTGYTFNVGAGLADSAFIQIFRYDTADRLIRDSVFELHLGVWRIAARSFYTYDAAGDLTLVNHYANMTDTSFLLPLVEQSRYQNTYDASHRLITVLTSIYDGAALAGYVKDTFSYSGALPFHNSWKQYQFDGIHGTWKPQYYMAKHLTAGKPDTVFHNGWDSLLNRWVPIAMDIAGYNTYNNPDTIFNYEYNWTAYSATPDYTTVYYYDTFTYVPPTTAVPVVTSGEMKIYPNPATNTLVIDQGNTARTGNLTIAIYNITGQIMSRQVLPAIGKSQLNINYLTPGTYWIIAENDGTIYRKQFIKQ